MVSPTTLKVDIVDKKRYPSANESGLENVSGGKRRKKECTTPSDGAVNEGKGNSTTAGFSSKERETDPHRIRQRSKQVEYGKNTVGKRRMLVLGKRFLFFFFFSLSLSLSPSLSSAKQCS